MLAPKETSMPRRLWTIKAKNSAGWEIDFTSVYFTIPPREELVIGLLDPAHSAKDLAVPGWSRGADAEHRLAELGFMVTSIADSEPPD
jgi:hypothetical protein